MEIEDFGTIAIPGSVDPPAPMYAQFKLKTMALTVNDAIQDFNPPPVAAEDSTVKHRPTATVHPIQHQDSTEKLGETRAQITIA